VCRTIGSEPTCFAQRTSVPLIGLDLLIARGVHGRKVRVGDDDFVAELFEVASDPFALGRGFDEDARAWTFSKYFVETCSGRLDAPFS
jgi:hypothetical protein